MVLKRNPSILPLLPESIQVEVAFHQLDFDLATIWPLISSQAKKAFITRSLGDERMRRHAGLLLSDAMTLGLDAKSQVEIAWPADDSVTWMKLSDEARVLAFYRAIIEQKVLPEPLNPNGDVKMRMLAVLLGDESTTERFARAHQLFQDYVIEIAWQSSEELNLYPLLPDCYCPDWSGVKFCEGRPWLVQVQADIPPEMRAFCPRKVCQCENARIFARRDQSWGKWSLLEVLAVKNITPSLPELRDVAEYVPKLCGWVNRLNEIRGRLRCSACEQIMRPNYKYARNLAVYNSTVFSCASGIGHDLNIFLSHCWGCGQIIDSRESRIRIEGFYICIHCGSGPRTSERYSCGKICPNCGGKIMRRLNGNPVGYRCEACAHEISIPRFYR
jgi:hypothetical protein